MIEVWGRKNAYNVQKVLWALAELNIKYVHYDVGSTEGDLETPEFIKMNPHSRVPVVVDSDLVIWESNTIIRYLSASYGENVLWPSDPVRRSYADRWMDWELATLQSDFIALFWSFYRTPEKDRDAKQIEHMQARCSQHFSKLNNHLAKHNYIAGDSFTMGDISCATCLYRYFEMGLEVERQENILAWYERMTNREAYQQNVMLLFTELRGRQSF